MGRKLTYIQFYPNDWLGDLELQGCSASTQGIWINLICLMHRSNRYGYLVIKGRAPSTKEIANLLRKRKGMVDKAIKELLEAEVCRITSDGILYSQRMIEDEEKRRVKSMAGSKGAAVRYGRSGDPAIADPITPPMPQNPIIPESQNPIPPRSQKRSTGPRKATLEERFDSFWSVYPRKVGKKAALREWIRITPSVDLTKTMIEAVEKWKASKDWTKDDGQYIPHPRTWLHQGRWDDEPTERIRKAAPNPSPREEIPNEDRCPVCDGKGFRKTDTGWDSTRNCSECRGTGRISIKGASDESWRKAAAQIAGRAYQRKAEA